MCRYSGCQPGRSRHLSLYISRHLFVCFKYTRPQGSVWLPPRSLACFLSPAKVETASIHSADGSACWNWLPSLRISVSVGYAMVFSWSAPLTRNPGDGLRADMLGHQTPKKRQKPALKISLWDVLSLFRAPSATGITHPACPWISLVRNDSGPCFWNQSNTSSRFLSDSHYGLIKFANKSGLRLELIQWNVTYCRHLPGSTAGD